MELDKTIDSIIENFRRQLDLYNTMYELSLNQLNALQAGSSVQSKELKQILARRQELIKEISNLNKANISLREEVKDSLGIADFVFSQLKNNIDDRQFQFLQEVITGIEKILVLITESDNISETLMRQSLKSPNRPVPRGTKAQAVQAYNENKNYKKE